MKKTVRMAKIYVEGIKKRCRKQINFYLTATGETDQEAIKNLSDKVEAESFNYKSLIFNQEGLLFDVHMLGEIIIAPMFPVDAVLFEAFRVV